MVCGVKTKIVTSVDISGWTLNDTYLFALLVKKTAENFRIEEVSADKAYLSHKNLETVERLGGVPFIPFKSNTVVPKDDSIWSRMYF